VKKFTPSKGKGKKIPMPASKTPDLAAGSHKLKALQGMKGIVKPGQKKKIEDIEHFMKHRNEYDMKNSRMFAGKYPKSKKKRSNFI
jgi:hypothetical protein